MWETTIIVVLTIEGLIALVFYVGYLVGAARIQEPEPMVAKEEPSSPQVGSLDHLIESINSGDKK